ncbi:MAG: hypothetical protein K2K21_06070, partial [Lachnospiraceae bacterium]|nr:hypothetical protein [Lachnospiraceae bacterium]
MKKKILSLFLATSMVVSLTACGGDGGNTEQSGGNTEQSGGNTEQSGGNKEEYGGNPKKDNEDENVREKLHIVVDGTLTATVDSGQDAFIEQWEAAVSEKLGHPIELTIDQLDHSDYSGTVSRYLTTGTPGDGQYPDALIMSASMFREYAPTGLLWDLSDAYANAEFQSRLQLKSVNENMKTASGELYGFAPTYGNGCVTYIKQSWLDAVGKTVDDIKTYDDYYALLKEFHDGDPDGDGVNGKTYGVIAAGFGKLDEAPFINYMPEFW